MADVENEAKDQGSTVPKPKVDPFPIAGEMLTPLTKVATLIAGFCGAAYLYGWRYLSHYYAAVNASWAMELLEPTEIMQQAMSAMATVLGMTVVMLWAFYSEAISRKGLRRLILGFASAALVLMVAVFVVPERFEEGVSAFLNIALTFGVSMVIAHSIISVAEGVSSLKGERNYLYASLLFGSVLGQATFTASETAGVDFDPRRSDLPHVSLYENPSVDWRLVRALKNGSMLIASLEPGGVAMTVVEPDKVSAIRSHSHIKKLMSPPVPR